MIAQRALTGTATLSHGLKAKALLHNVESLALSVMVQDQSGEKISLFLEDWELARVALSCHIALDMLCQEMPESWLLGCCCQRGLLSQQGKPFLSPWTGCDRKGGM